MKKIIYTLIAIFTFSLTQAQVGIGTTTPDTSSILDVTSSTKGVLLPRINLTSATMDLDNNTATTQPAALLIYNSGTTFNKGYFWWNGTEWVSVDNSPSSPPNLDNLYCNIATLSPSKYTTASYTGYLKVPYDGGNGSNYTGGLAITSTGVTGLTATLLPGKLAYGVGDLVFKVTGTPSAASPQAASFDLSGLKVSGSEIIKGTYSTCTVTVGNSSDADIRTAAYVGTFVDVTGGAKFTVKTLDGLFEVGFNIRTNEALALADVVIAYAGPVPSVPIMWNGHSSYEGGSFGFGSDAFTPPLAPIVGTSTAWGNEDVFYVNIPENRKYIWTQTDTSKKRIYEYDFFMAATPATYANRAGAKCYIFAKEIIAQ